MEEAHPRRWNRKMAALVVLLLILAAGFVVPAVNQVTCVRSLQAQRCTQCRNLVISLKSYAGDVCGNYPDADKKVDAKTSNQAFRMLFVRGLLDDERDFGGHGSPFVPDGDIGTEPDFKRALEAGENGWAMTSGLSDSAAGNMPLVYENTVDEVWPPRWIKSDEKGRVLGRLPSQDKAVVGRNDGTVAVERLQSRPDGHWVLENAAQLEEANKNSYFKVLNAEK